MALISGFTANGATVRKHTLFHTTPPDLPKASKMTDIPAARLLSNTMTVLSFGVTTVRELLGCMARYVVAATMIYDELMHPDVHVTHMERQAHDEEKRFEPSPLDS